MNGEDDYSSASIEDNLRRIEEEQARQEEETRARQRDIANTQRPSTNSGMGNLNIADLASAQGLGEVLGASTGGAGAVTGGSALTGEASGAAATAYGGGATSSVLPGIFGGANVGSGASAGASGIFGGGVAGGASGGGAGSMAAAAGPWAALGALILGHNQWAKGQGLRDNEDYPLQTGLEGRALYKDSARYQEWGNRAFDGLGDGVRLAGLGSSPTELFKGKNWAEAAKIAAKGGLLGGLLRKIF